MDNKIRGVLWLSGFRVSFSPTALKGPGFELCLFYFFFKMRHTKQKYKMGHLANGAMLASGAMLPKRRPKLRIAAQTRVRVWADIFQGYFTHPLVKSIEKKGIFCLILQMLCFNLNQEILATSLGKKRQHLSARINYDLPKIT